MDEGFDVGSDNPLDFESGDLSSDFSDLDSQLENDLSDDFIEDAQGEVDDLVDVDIDLPEDTESAEGFPEPEVDFFEEDIIG